MVQDADGRIAAFQEKPKREEAKSRLVNTGIYLFEPEILNWIPEHGPYDIGGELFPKLAEVGERLYGLNLDTPWQWLDIGRTQDFHAVSMKALKGEIRGFAIPGREVRPGVWMGLNVNIDLDRVKIMPPMFIGGSAVVQDGASLVGPVSIGAGSVVAGGAHVERTVVMEHTRIGGNAYFMDKIVGGHYCADTDGTVLDGRHTDTAWLFADARSLDNGLTADQEDILDLAMRHAA